METQDILKELLADTALRLEVLARKEHLRHVNERDHQAKCFSSALAQGLDATGYRPAQPKERKLSWPEHWPRVGDVDALLVPTNGGAVVFVELKCGNKSSSLRSCAWDAVKCALGLRLQDAGEAYLLAGTEAKLWNRPVPGAQLFSDARPWQSEQIRTEYRAAFVEYEECDDPPPTLVPAAFETCFVDSADFVVDGKDWQLRLARVRDVGAEWFRWQPFLTPKQQALAREWRRTKR